MYPRRHLINFAVATFVGLAAPLSFAADVPADVQAKVEKAKKRLAELAADPLIVAAVREANGKDAGGMNNGKWSDLPDTDPAVKTLMANKASAQIAKWEASDDNINKLVLRDLKGNLVAASAKPLLFNNASRPQFANAVKGQPWAASEVKPDATTQVPSVQLGVPVLDGGKTIGVLHAGVTAK
jgi:hypothetical protein